MCRFVSFGILSSVFDLVFFVCVRLRHVRCQQVEVQFPKENGNKKTSQKGPLKYVFSPYLSQLFLNTVKFVMCEH